MASLSRALYFSLISFLSDSHSRAHTHIYTHETALSSRTEGGSQQNPSKPQSTSNQVCRLNGYVFSLASWDFQSANPEPTSGRRAHSLSNMPISIIAVDRARGRGSQKPITSNLLRQHKSAVPSPFSSPTALKLLQTYTPISTLQAPNAIGSTWREVKQANRTKL